MIFICTLLGILRVNCKLKACSKQGVIPFGLLGGSIPWSRFFGWFSGLLPSDVSRLCSLIIFCRCCNNHKNNVHTIYLWWKLVISLFECHVDWNNWQKLDHYRQCELEMLIHKNPGREICLAKDIHVICDILNVAALLNRDLQAVSLCMFPWMIINKVDHCSDNCCVE